MREKKMEKEEKKPDFSADFKRSAPEIMGRRCTPQNRTKNLIIKSFFTNTDRTDGTDI